MFRNYLKATFRYLLCHRVFSGINLFGLATGLSVCFFALLYVTFELSYDRFHERAGQIYRLVTDIETSVDINYQSSSAPMASALLATFPEVKAATRIFLDYLIVRKDQDNYKEEPIAYADSTLFSVFTFPLIQGDPRSVLNAPWNIVLSETASRKYFGSDNPVGKTLLINEGEPAYVAGIMKDIPYNSHFRVDILVSMSSLISKESDWDENWKRFGFYTYLLLPENFDALELSSKLPDFIKQHIDQTETKYTLLLEPLKRVYLYGKARGSRVGSSASGSISNIYIFSLVAAFVLFIGCFNFINLTTALSVQRVKEIGVRKVIGASKAQLIIQFLMDSIFLCLLAFVVALALCIAMLPLFNQLSGKIVSVNIFEHVNYILLLLSVAVMIGALSGIFAALFLSGLQPISGLKKELHSRAKASMIRKILVVTQFSISIILIVATAVVYEQLYFMQNQQLGFKKDHLLVIDFQFDARINQQDETVVKRLTGIPGIDLVSMSSCIPGRANHKFLTKVEKQDDEIQELLSDTYFVDYDFLLQYEIEVVAGRDFSRQFASDHRNAMIINEAAARTLGYHDPNDAIGKRFWQRGGSGLIIGVVKDFHFHSFQEEVQPLTFLVSKSFFTFLSIKISSQNLPQTIGRIENEWQQLVPGLPLIYFFADDAYNAQYVAEERFGKLFICFAALAIILSCLGLLGLSVFSITRRTREIGIRKILGAPLFGIVSLLTKEFMLLIVVAFIIAVPVTWISMNQWLQEFAYRINISWWIFVAAGMACLLVAFATISFMAIKAALANPVEALKTE